MAHPLANLGEQSLIGIVMADKGIYHALDLS